MIQFEQVFVGHNNADPQGQYCVTAHSPGVGAAVRQEILEKSLNWGMAHTGALEHPVLLSFPLKAVMPAIKGPLFAIIRVTPTFPVAFHAIVIAKRDFRSFAYNPFGVQSAGSFLDSLAPGQRLSRGTMSGPSAMSVFSPPANPADVGLVDEALQLFLLKGRLIMNLDRPGPEADRVLGLTIHFLPVNLKEKLSFASFSGSGDPGYELAAAFAVGNGFDSWQRLFMTMENQGIPEPVRRYVAQVRNALVTGDPQGVNTGEVVPVGRNAVEAKTTKPLAAVPLGPALGGEKSPAPRAAVVAGVGGGEGRGPGIGLASVAGGGAGTRSGNASPVGIDGARTRKGRTRLIRQALPTRKRPVSRKSRQMGVFTLVVALLVTGWVYLDRSGKGREWGIFDLMGPGGTSTENKQAPTLLEVVDVGAEYGRQLARLQRNRLIPGSGDDRQLRRAQADLLADAAGPLLQQVDLFLDLARDGIQQGHRPDRERVRLGALAEQGRVLEAEMGRLELAFFSLAEGILWGDLGQLSDTQVHARRDSLAGLATFQAAAAEVGSATYQGPLTQACRNMEGMAGLLELFAAPQWSSRWEKELKAAAEKVSPTSSAMSRAYRNNAFTLLRLKRAERSDVGRQGAFVADWNRGAWLSPGVKDVLKDLRHKSALFGRGKMPPLLQGVLSLYSRLENPDELAREIGRSAEAWQDLLDNPGRRFDPAVYENHLERMRFQALAAAVAEGRSEEDIPRHLREGWDPAVMPHFLAAEGGNENVVGWSALAEAGRETFLGHWAEQRALRVQSRLDEMKSAVDRAWFASRPLEQDLRERSLQGLDWTGVWLDLRDELQKILGNAPSVFAEDPVRTAQRNHAMTLLQAMSDPHPLTLQSVVVRLDQAALADAAGVVVEFQVEGRDQVHRSAPIKMGPAAPAGTGWVGTGSWDLTLPVSPLDGFRAQVLVPGRAEPVLTVDYPALEERVGPGAFSRPRKSEGGSLLIRTGEAWWRSLQLPTMTGDGI